MKKVTIHPAVLLTVLCGAIVVGFSGGAYFGFGKGYAQGSFDGVHDASRSATSAMTTLMTKGFFIAQPDGKEKKFVLQPVEANKN